MTATLWPLVRLLATARSTRRMALAVCCSVACAGALLISLHALTLSPAQRAAQQLGAADGSIAIETRLGRPAPRMGTELRRAGASEVSIESRLFIGLRHNAAPRAFSFIETAGPDFSTSERIQLTSGHWPRQAHELAAASTAGLAIGDELTTDLGGREFVVVGIVDLPLDPADDVLVGMTGALTDLPGDPLTPPDATVLTTFYFNSLTTERVANQFSKRDVIVTRDYLLADRQPPLTTVMGGFLPLLALPPAVAFIFASVVTAWSMRNRRTLNDLGISTAQTRRSFITAMLFMSAIGAAAGVGAGLLVGWAVRPVLQTVSHSPLSPYSPDVVSLLVLAASTCVATAVAIASTESTPALLRLFHHRPAVSTVPAVTVPLGSLLIVAAVGITVASPPRDALLAALAGAALWVVGGTLLAPTILKSVLRERKPSATPTAGPLALGMRILREDLVRAARLVRSIVAVLGITGAMLFLASGSIANLRTTQGSIPAGMAVLPVAEGAEADLPATAIAGFEETVSAGQPVIVSQIGALATGGDVAMASLPGIETLLGPLTVEQRDVLEAGGVLCIDRVCPQDAVITTPRGERHIPTTTFSLPPYAYLPFGAIGVSQEVASLDEGTSRTDHYYVDLAPQQLERARLWPMLRGLDLQVLTSSVVTPSSLPLWLQMVIGGIFLAFGAALSYSVRADIARRAPALSELLALGVPRRWIADAISAVVLVPLVTGVLIAAAVSAMPFVVTWLAVPGGFVRWSADPWLFWGAFLVLVIGVSFGIARIVPGSVEARLGSGSEAA